MARFGPTKKHSMGQPTDINWAKSPVQNRLSPLKNGAIPIQSSLFFSLAFFRKIYRNLMPISMASTTTIVSPQSNESFRMKTLPIIDLRFLSQSELHSLSHLSSSSSSSSSSQSTSEPDVLIPKIDRSVFNESAGSRKQTYSRLRLAPRKPQFHSPPSSSAIRPQSPDRTDVNNAHIIALFNQLFVGDSHCDDGGNGDGDEDLVLINHIYDESVPDSSYAIFQSIPVDVIDSSYGQVKRRRGRPRKDGSRFEMSNGSAAPVSKSGCDKAAAAKVEEEKEKEEIVMVML